MSLRLRYSSAELFCLISYISPFPTLDLDRMKGFLRFAYLFLLLAGFSAAVSTADAQFVPLSQHYEFEKGRKLYEEGLYRQSAEYLRKYLYYDAERAFHEEASYYLTLAKMASDSVHSEIYANRFLMRYPTGLYAVSLLDEMAGRHYQAGNYETARHYFGRAFNVVAEDDKKVQFLFWMAESSLQADDADSASVLYTKLSDTWPGSDLAPKALYSRGSLYLNRDDFDTSAEIFEELRERFPNHAVTRQVGTALGELHYRQERYEESISVLKNELSYLEGDALLKAILLIAESHNYLGQFDQAATEYRRYINLSEDDMQARPAHYGLGWVYHKQQVYHWAADSFQNAAFGDDQLARKALYYEAINRKLSGRYDLALDTFEKFGKQYANGFWMEQVYYEWALTAFELGRNNLAIEVLQQLIRADIDLEDAGKMYSLLGEAYFANNEFSRAVQAFELAEQTVDVDPDMKRQAQFQRGWVMYENHAYREARQAFEAVYRDQPSGPLAAEALFWSADSYYNLRQWGDAARQFERFVDGYPDHEFTGAAIYSLGWVNFHLQNYERAISYFEEFDQNYEPPPMALFPYEVDTRLRMGDSYYAMSRYDEAIRNYDKATGTDPGGDYAIFQIGNSHFRQNETFEAVRSFRRLLRVFPYSRLREQVQYNIGHIYFQTGNYDQAIEEFHSLINNYPGSEWAARAQYQIGDAYYNAGNYDAAVEAYRIILDEYPRSGYTVDAVNGIQFAQQAAGDVDTSMEILESFLNQHPQTETADQLRFRQAENLVQAGDYHEAISSFRYYVRVTTSESRVPEAYFNIGEAYEQLNDRASAVEAYSEIVDRYPESDRMDHALLHIGRLELEQNRYSEAIASLERLIEREGRLHVEALSTLGEAYLANDQPNRAEMAFDRALEHNENHDPSLIGKGKVALQTGQFMDADRYFRQVAESNTLERGAEAQYYLGLVEQSRRNHDAAIEAFSRVNVLYETYDVWVAKAMLGTALSYRETGQSGRAEQTLRDIIERFPDTEFAREASSEL